MAKKPAGTALLGEASPGGSPALFSRMDCRRAAFDALIEKYSGDELIKRQREVQAHYKATLRQSDEVESEGKHGPIHDWGADKNV